MMMMRRFKNKTNTQCLYRTCASVQCAVVCTGSCEYLKSIPIALHSKQNHALPNKCVYGIAHGCSPVLLFDVTRRPSSPFNSFDPNDFLTQSHKCNAIAFVIPVCVFVHIRFHVGFVLLLLLFFFDPFILW